MKTISLAKAFTAMAAALLAAALCPAAASAATGFSDVPADSWYAQGGYVDYVAEHGLMTGYRGSDRFGPDDMLSRIDAIVILYRALGGEEAAAKTSIPYFYEEDDTTGFSDTFGGRYYSAAINWAKCRGIAQGYGGTDEFRPWAPVSRQEFVAFMARSKEYKIPPTLGPNPASVLVINRYQDCKDLEEWALWPLDWGIRIRSVSEDAAVTGNLIEGNTDAKTGWRYLRPYDTATRAEAAKMVAIYTNVDWYTIPDL